MNATGRKITLLPELIYLGRLSVRKETTADAATTANIAAAPFESGHV
jgi:hypothetical protein